MPSTDVIDISAWQVGTNWDAVAGAGIRGAIIKASEGTGYVSESFHRDWGEARRVGLAYRGAYHYMRPGRPVAAQVDLFVSTVGPLGVGDLGPVCDAEEAGLTSTTVIDWMERAGDATGKQAILYASSSFVESHLGADPALRRFPLWVAHYTNGSPWVPAPYDSVFLHQWSSSGVVPGVVGRCDVNQILDHGTLDDLAGSFFTPQSLEEDLTPEQAKQLTKVAALADTLDVSWAGWKFDDGRPVNHLMEAFHFVLLRLEQAVARIDQDRSATASGWEFPDGRKVTSLVEFIDLTTRMQMDQTDRVLTALEKLGEKVGNPAPSAPAPTVDEIVAGLLERAKPAA